MEPPKSILKNITTLFITLVLVIGLAAPATASLSLTPEERDYISGTGVIRAASIDGVAPLHYIDAAGEINGINVRILQEIADITGLDFAFELYESSAESIESGADILFSITYHYAPEDMILSHPYLISETILYMNSARDPKLLDNKTYAGLIGGTLPEGIKEENTLYYGTREESLDAVESGEADYGYGNAYSVAYYTLQNNYKNIVTIPKGKEVREYSIGFLNDDPTLISIINKGVDALDERHIHTLVLDMAAQVDRKVTFPIIMEVHGKKILGITAFIIAILLSAVIFNIRANNRLKLQNKRHELLSHISNECLFEYHIKSKRLELSEKCTRLFGDQGASGKVATLLIDALFNATLKEDSLTVRLPLADGATGVYRVVTSSMHDAHGRLYSIIGKLIDVTAEEEERQELISLAQIDGLTDLYNAATTRTLISQEIKQRDKQRKDALIVLDCDNLKKINDSYGHLTGDETLKTISRGLKRTFRESDVIGRIGGDEFCVYVKNIASTDFIRAKCGQLFTFLGKSETPPHVSVSIGIALPNDEKTYADLFEKADAALYRSKNAGKNRVVIHGEEQMTG